MCRKVLKSWEKPQAVSEFDGLVGQLPVGVDRMVICERWGRVNSFNEQSAQQRFKTPACVC